MVGKKKKIGPSFLLQLFFRWNGSIIPHIISEITSSVHILKNLNKLFLFPFVEKEVYNWRKTLLFWSKLKKKLLTLFWLPFPLSCLSSTSSYIFSERDFCYTYIIVCRHIIFIVYMVILHIYRHIHFIYTPKCTLIAAI